MPRNRLHLFRAAYTKLKGAPPSGCRVPIPDSRFPISDYRFPIPDYRLPLHACRAYRVMPSTSRSSCFVVEYTLGVMRTPRTPFQSIVVQWIL